MCQRHLRLLLLPRCPLCAGPPMRTGVAWGHHPMGAGTSRRGTDPPSSTSSHTRSVLEFAPALVPKQVPGWVPLPLPRGTERDSFTSRAPPLRGNHGLCSFAPEPAPALLRGLSAVAHWPAQPQARSPPSGPGEARGQRQCTGRLQGNARQSAVGNAVPWYLQVFRRKLIELS